MRKIALLILPLTVFVTTAIVSYFHYSERIYPHTYLNRNDVSLFQRDELDALLDRGYNGTFDLKIHDRIYSFTYKKLGILLDKKATVRILFENNSIRFPGNLVRFAESLQSQKMALPSLVFTQDFSNFIENSVFDFTTESDVYQVDNASKTVTFIDNEKKYRIDPEHLRSLLTFHFGEKAATYEPKLIAISNGEKRQSVEEQNKEIGKLFSYPLTVLVETDRTISVSFTPEDLKKMFAIEWGSEGVTLVPQEQVILYWMDAKIDPLIPRDKSTDKEKIKADIISSFLSRKKGMVSGPVLVKTSKKEPTMTHGEIAERYIEINISQQKMYLFYRGNLLSSYPVSTGLYYPTPVGRFQIMNKALEGYSDIFNVYMPYWMAFYYGWAGGQDAYFGIHELPYWYVGQERKQRPREFLGSPHTGGCVSLDIGAAKEVYDFSYVGMDVLIFP